nr:MAG TPA: hypothetical protein [Caudoviricetes sp.]
MLRSVETNRDECNGVRRKMSCRLKRTTPQEVKR